MQKQGKKNNATATSAAKNSTGKLASISEVLTTC